jgi:hypothetical protein
VEDNAAPKGRKLRGVLPRSFPPEQAKLKDYRLEIPLELLCTGDAAEAAIDPRFMAA